MFDSPKSNASYIVYRKMMKITYSSILQKYEFLSYKILNDQFLYPKLSNQLSNA